MVIERQMSELYDMTKQNIFLHIKNNIQENVQENIQDN